MRRIRCGAVIPGRNKLLVSAARVVAKELRGAKTPNLPGRLEPVPVKGLAGGARRGRVLGILVRYGLYASLASSAVAFFLTAPSASGRLGSGKGIVELAIGAIMAAEGLLLVSNWHGARWRLVQRWVAKQGGTPGMLDALRWRLFGYALFALGLAWVGVGVIELGQGASDLL
jgi:hypothetical protein